MPHSTFLTISRIDSYGTAKTDEDMPTPQQDHWDAWLKPGPIDDITTDGFVTKLTLSATTTGLTNDLKATWTMAPNSGTGNVHVFFGAPKPGVDTECKTKMFRFSNVSAREMSFEAQLPARAETYVAVVFERRTSGGKVRRYSAIRYLKR